MPADRSPGSAARPEGTANATRGGAATSVPAGAVREQGDASGPAEERCDVLIVGGGPVGILLAILLTETGVDVVVWEARDKPPTRSRAIGIHPPALAVLRGAGVSDAIVAEAALVRRGVARAGERLIGSVDFARVHPEFPFVTALPQHRTEAILRERLRALNPGALRTGVELAALADTADGVRGTSAGRGAVLTARVLVGADGPASTVRRLSGIRSAGHDYPDRYAMGDYPDPRIDGPDAVIRLSADGVLESFPLPGGLRRYVALLPREGRSVTPRAPEGDAAMLARLVAERGGGRIDPEACTMFSAFGVRRRLAGRLVDGRRVLLGDAAHEISPIGGQGMNLGWLDAAVLAPAIARAVGARRGDGTRAPALRSPGAALGAYARGRRRAARRAGWQAGINTALGRRAPGWLRPITMAGLALVLRSPLRGPLAAAYAMAWENGVAGRDGEVEVEVEVEGLGPGSGAELRPAEHQLRGDE